MITDPMPTVAKSILANITSSLEELELDCFDHRCDTHTYVHRVCLYMLSNDRVWCEVLPPKVCVVIVQHNLVIPSAATS